MTYRLDKQVKTQRETIHQCATAGYPTLAPGWHPAGWRNEATYMDRKGTRTCLYCIKGSGRGALQSVAHGSLPASLQRALIPELWQQLWGLQLQPHPQDLFPWWSVHGIPNHAQYAAQLRASHGARKRGSQEMQVVGKVK